MPLLTFPPAFPANSLTLNPSQQFKRQSITEMESALGFPLRGRRKVMYGMILSKSQERLYSVKNSHLFQKE